MQKHQDQQSHQAILKKMARSGTRPKAIEAISEEMAGSPPESLADEVSRWLLNVKGTLRTGNPQDKAGFAVLMEAFVEIARKKGIPASHFYGSVLEKVLVEEAAPLSSKQGAKERILDAALDVFSIKGFHSATMDEIAEKAGVGKGTLYRYFATKEKLFANLMQTRLDELEKAADSEMDGNDDVLTMISKLIRVYFEFFDRNQRLYRLIIQERIDLAEHAPDQYFRRVMRAIPRLKRKIYEGTQRGILKDVDFQTVFYGTMGFAHGVIEKWLARDCSYPLVDELSGVLEVLFHGFVRNGAKI